MADQTSSSLSTPHSAFSRLFVLLEKIPQPCCSNPADANSGCDLCDEASNQLEELKKDVLYIQKSLKKLIKFEQDLGTAGGELVSASMVGINEPRNYHQLARAAQQLKKQLPSASYYQFPREYYHNHPPAADDNPIGIEMEYNNLPLQQKKCLWCCLVFPENEEIKKRVLINWWIGEGLLTGRSSTGRAMKLELEAEELLDLLQTKQLIEQVEKKRRGSDSWRMDPSVRSFLTSKMKGDKLFDLHRRILDGEAMLLKSRLRVGSLDGMVNPVLTVFNINKPTIGEDEAKTLASMKNLTVLHLGRSLVTQEFKIQLKSLELITKGLKKMKQLRLLSFQGISSLKELPSSVYSLSKLMVLDLRACRALESLNWRILYMKNLRHLDMSGCHLLLQIPHEIRRLSKLEVLKGVVIGHDTRGCILHKLRLLNKLHKLSLFVIRKDFPSRQDMLALANITELVKLKIVWNPAATEETMGAPCRESPAATEESEGAPGDADHIVQNPPSEQELQLSHENPAATDESEGVAGDVDHPVQNSQSEHELQLNPENPAAAEVSESAPGNADHPVQNPPSEQVLQLNHEKLEKLDLWCTPNYAAPNFLAPGRLPRLHKLYLRGAEYINHLNYNHGSGGAEGNKWNVKILRLRFLPNLEMSWEELMSLFPDLSYLEMQECPKLQFPPDCDLEGVWKNENS